MPLKTISFYIQLWHTIMKIQQMWGHCRIIESGHIVISSLTLYKFSPIKKKLLGLTQFDEEAHFLPTSLSLVSQPCHSFGGYHYLKNTT